MNVLYTSIWQAILLHTHDIVCDVLQLTKADSREEARAVWISPRDRHEPKLTIVC